MADKFVIVRGRNGLYKVIQEKVCGDMYLLIPVNEDRSPKRYDTALLRSEKRIVDVSPQQQVRFGGMI